MNNQHPLIKGESQHYLNCGEPSVLLLEKMFGYEEMAIFAKINAMKYRMRVGNKDNCKNEVIKIKDYEKYYQYLNCKIESEKTTLIASQDCDGISVEEKTLDKKSFLDNLNQKVKAEATKEKYGTSSQSRIDFLNDLSDTLNELINNPKFYETDELVDFWHNDYHFLLDENYVIYDDENQESVLIAIDGDRFYDKFLS